MRALSGSKVEGLRCGLKEKDQWWIFPDTHQNYRFGEEYQPEGRPQLRFSIEVLLETADVSYPDGWKLQEDNSSIHKSKCSESYKKSVRIRTIDWPANSPDLNPIENLWAVLKKRIQNKALKDIKNLGKLIETEWQTFDPEFLANFITSMKRRCQLVIESNGKKIDY